MKDITEFIQGSDIEVWIKNTVQRNALQPVNFDLFKVSIARHTGRPPFLLKVSCESYPEPEGVLIGFLPGHCICGEGPLSQAQEEFLLRLL